MNDNRTMSGVRPYTRKELGLLRESSEAASKLRGRHVSGSDELARWLATLARVEQERDEAEHSRLFNHTAAKLALDQRDDAIRSLAAAQAECAQLREALEGFTRWMGQDGSRIEAFVDCSYEMRNARNLLLATRSPDAALREVVTRAVIEAQSRPLRPASQVVNDILGSPAQGQRPAQEGGSDAEA